MLNLYIWGSNFWLVSHYLFTVKTNCMYNLQRKGIQCLQRKLYERGKKICDYSGELCKYATFKERQRHYNASESGSFILEFKYKDKHWAIDWATKEDNSLGHLINHSRKLQNCKPIVGEDRGKPFVYFIATSDILPDNEILYDYGDNSKMSTKYFPWLRD